MNEVNDLNEDFTSCLEANLVDRLKWFWIQRLKTNEASFLRMWQHRWLHISRRSREQPSVAGTTPHMQSAQAKVAENNRKHTKLRSLTRWRNPTFWSSTRNGPLSIFSDCTRPLSIFFLFTWWAWAGCRTPRDNPTGQSVEFNQAPPLPYQCNERLVTSKWIKMEHV